MTFDLTFSAAEIERIIATGVVRRYTADNSEWKAHLRACRRGLYRHLIHQRLRSLLKGPVKSVSNVRGSYNQAWAQEMYPGSPGVEASTQLLEWRQGGLEVRGWTEKRVHLWLFLQVLERLRPQSVLEIGCGNGALIMMLSVLYPASRIAGVDLTEQGMIAARQMLERSELPQGMIDFLPAPVADPRAFRRIIFAQANAAVLPFPARSFDVTMTSLALEQMDQVKDQVLAEIQRVTRDYVVMIEPFPEHNRTLERRLHTRANGYFSLPIAQLHRYGLEPVLEFSDFPAKIMRGTGLVVARVRH